MIKSAHCTTTIEMKKAVWQVYSSCLRASYVYDIKVIGLLIRMIECITRHYYPILSVRVLEIVKVLIIPFPSESEQQTRPETVLSHDDKVDEETGRSLHHTDLTVSHRNQSIN